MAWQAMTLSPGAGVIVMIAHHVVAMLSLVSVLVRVFADVIELYLHALVMTVFQRHADAIKKNKLVKRFNCYSAV